MKAKLIVEGKEFDIEINDPELQKLVASVKKTGYERVPGEYYFYVDTDSSVDDYPDDGCDAIAAEYKNANYYSDRTIAENNARADKLMRQLRRFAALHRDKELDWSNRNEEKWYIFFDYVDRGLFCNNCWYARDPFSIYFPSRECVQEAIDAFHDELIWYFTEYKDSL